MEGKGGKRRGLATLYSVSIDRQSQAFSMSQVNLNISDMFSLDVPLSYRTFKACSVTNSNLSEWTKVRRS